MNYTQCGSALALPYADGIAQTCVTSPPYYGLRDYGTARWEGGDGACDHRHKLGGEGAASAKQNTSAGTQTVAYRDTCGKCGARRIDSQIGLESTPAAYVAQIVAAMREVWRVLRDDGTLWLNLGDSYAGSTATGGTKSIQGTAKRVGAMFNRANAELDVSPKNLIGIPWRVAFALQDDGWYLRSDIIWAKPNPMPESVTDRPTKAHEYVFLLAKQPRYFYDAEAIKERQADASAFRAKYGWNGRTDDGSNGAITGAGIRKMAESGMSMGEAGLVPLDGQRNTRSVWNIATTPYAGAHFATMPPELARRCILAGSRPGDIVLDPFAGSGTTAMVALQNGRRAIGTELNPKYLRLQDDRTRVTIGLGMVNA